MSNCCCSTTTTKTPVYLENVIYFFKKLDTHYKNIFALKTDCHNCNNSNTSNNDSAVLLALDKLALIIGNKGSCCQCNEETKQITEACNCDCANASISPEALNDAIDYYFSNIDTNDSDIDESLSSYFDNKLATLTGGD